RSCPLRACRLGAAEGSVRRRGTAVDPVRRRGRRDPVRLQLDRARRGGDRPARPYVSRGWLMDARLPDWWEPLLSRVGQVRAEDISRLPVPAEGGRASAVLVLLADAA